MFLDIWSKHFFLAARIFFLGVRISFLGVRIFSCSKEKFLVTRKNSYGKKKIVLSLETPSWHQKSFLRKNFSLG